MAVPMVFRGKGGSQLATYNFTDIASGTGYITFYGASISGAYILNNNTIYSDMTSTSLTIGTHADYYLDPKMDFDFDVLINNPLTIKGVVQANVPVQMTSGSAQPLVTLRRVRNGVETDIASCWGTVIVRPGTAHPTMGLICFTVPLTQYKKGDTLRITVQVYYIGNAGQGIYVAHDPKNRADTQFGTEPTQMVFYLPSKIIL